MSGSKSFREECRTRAKSLRPKLLEGDQRGLSSMGKGENGKSQSERLGGPHEALLPMRRGAAGR